MIFAMFINLGWSQIDEQCCSNNVGGQTLNHLTISHLNNVETCVINMIIQNLYFAFCQTFQPNRFVRDDVHPNSPVTNEQFGLDLNSRSWDHGTPFWELLWVDLSVDLSSWEIRNEQKKREK